MPWRARREYVLVAAVWAVWLLAVLGVVAGGTASGAISDPHHSWPHYGGPFWPLFIWDYGWYEVIAIFHYPAHVTAPVYAFFPLWPLLLRASGSVADWVVGFAAAIVASAIAFAGVAAAIPSGRRLRAAVGMAIWPGSFVLLLAYPDVIAVAAGAWAAALILRGRPWLAGLFAAVAAFARPTGFLLAIPLLFAGRASVRGRIFAVLSPIAAAGAVHVYFWRRSGDALAFLHAESLPVWSRKGPQRLAKWPGELAHALHVHAALVIPAAFVGIAVIALVYRRFGAWYAAAVAYVFAVAAALLGAQTTPTRIQSAILALTVLGIAFLWYRGRAYWPWALFATAVIGVSVFSGSVTSLGRQAVFAFPLFWTVADAPRPARHPVILVAAIAANVAYALTLARYAP